jgi:hypothetical protein
MSTSKNKTISITPKADEKKTLSAQQKQFNTLTKKIDLQKQRLVEWQDTRPLYQQKVVESYEPLQETFSQHKLEWVQLLDRHYDLSLFKKTDKVKIRHLICEVSEHLIADYQMDELKPLFNKYSEEDFDSLNEDRESFMADMMKNLAKDMFDVDLGDDIDMSSPEMFQAHLHEKILEREEAEAQHRAGTVRKKTKKQLEKEARLQEEEDLASKSVREVYRKLVAVLHPDREPDPEEQKRKTELMQRVNIAYGKKDLLLLLALQLEIEQINPAELSLIADSRLKYFNKILKEQLAELEQETNQIEDVFKINLNIPPFQRLAPKQMMSMLARDIKDLEIDISDIKREIKTFQNPASFKAWLKTYQIPRVEDSYYQDSLPFDFM